MITGLLVKEFNRNINPRTGLGSVSIKAFYLRRARRILPAALFVIIAINVWAQFRLNILQVSQIKADSVWTIFFGANITFLRQATDYFAQNNAVSPLQHYWSLSVEEQFYTVWPVLFLAALSFSALAIRGRLIEGQTQLRIVFAVIGVASFAWLLFEFTNSPTTAYFSTFSRAWELALGGLLSMVSFSSFAERFRPQIRALRFISLVAVIGAIGIVTPNNFGYTLVIPAVATGLLLLSGAHAKGDLVYRLLSSRVLNGLGAISFSLYLWHWPVFVFGRQEGWMETLQQKTIGVVVCIVLGTVSYFLVEKTFLAIPLPQPKRQTPPRPREFSFSQSRIATASTPIAVLTTLTYVTYPSIFPSVSPTNVASEEWIPPATAESFAPSSAPFAVSTTAPGLLPVGVNLKSYESLWQRKVYKGINLMHLPVNLNPKLVDLPLFGKNIWTNCQGYANLSATNTQVCTAGASQSKYRAVVLGDSHARVLWPLIMKSLDLSKWSITLLGQGNCPIAMLPIPVSQQCEWNKKCNSHRQYTFNYVKEIRPQLVVASQAIYTSQNPESLKVGLGKSFEHLVPYAKKVVYVGQVGLVPNLTECISNDQALTGCKIQDNQNFAVVKSESDIAFASHVSFFNLLPYLCTDGSPSGKCPPIIGNVATLYDGGHLTQPMAEALAPFFASYLASLKVPYLAQLLSEK